MQNHIASFSNRNFNSVERKLEVVNAFRNQTVQNKSQLARDFNLTPKQVRRYILQEEELNRVKYNRFKKIITNRTCLFIAEEEEIFSRFQAKRTAKVPVSGCDLRNDMRELVYKEHPELENSEKPFKASNGWLVNFLKRKRLVRRRITTSGRPFPINSVQVLQDWVDNINNLIEEFTFLPMEILHMDETSMYMDMPGNYTYETLGARRVEAATTGKERTRLSCAYTGNSLGNKLDILGVIQREETFSQMLIPDNFIPTYSKKGK
jgi:hypothetical protein